MSGVDIITAILLAGIAIAVIVYLLYWLYQRSSKDMSFVRTGLGGEKVVLTGGALVLPIVHTITPVGMRTLRLEVRRGGEGALITQDRMRVEVVAEFYLRVRPERESVALAAQSLGDRTMDTERLKDLVQGRFVDALSIVAAQMTMDEMQEQRGRYVRDVKGLVEDALTQNGLELEAVSLTSFDQADIGLFNPQNAFDAEGLTRLTEQIEARRKKRNDIEQDTAIQIRNKNLDAEKLTLEIDKNSHYARLEQEQDVSVRKARQRADIAKERAEFEREAEEAEIRAHEEVEKSRIAQQKAVEAELSLRETRLTEEIEARRKHRNDVEKDTAIQIWEKNLQAEQENIRIERETEYLRLEQQRDIAMRRALRESETAQEEAERRREAEEAEIRAHEEVEKTRIGRERTLDAERIAHAQETERLEIQRRRILAIEEKDRAIAVAERQKQELEILAAVEEARARETAAAEQVTSAKETEIAERKKKVETILAALQAEREAILLTTIAAAEKTAAQDRMEADRFSSLAAQLRYEIDAAGKRALNEAENMRSDQNRQSTLRMKLVEHLEGIIRESVRPMENIGDIKILQVDGLPGLSGLAPTAIGGGGGDDSSSDPDGEGQNPSGPRTGGTLADNIVGAALRYRAQAPFVDTLLKEIGMSPNEITHIGNLLREEREAEGNADANKN